MVQIWASVGLASSLVLHCFAGMSNFPVPPRLSHIITDSHNGEPVTFDATNRELLTNLVTAAQLVSPIDTKPSGYCVLGATVPTRGSPGNALVNGAHPLTEGLNHWRFIGVDGASFGCGASTKAMFGSGWALNGLYLTSNGNLAGRGALKVGFVPNMPASPTVDWILEVAGNSIDVYIMVNNVSRGHAFSLNFPDTSVISSLRPMVTFDDKSDGAKVVVVDHHVTPLAGDITYKYPEQPCSLYDCKWKLENKYGIATGRNGIVLQVLNDGVSIHVANVLRSGGKFHPDGSIEASEYIASTKMRPPAPLVSSEEKMVSLLRTMKSWRLKDNLLTIDSGIGATTWEAYRDEPVTENPFITQ